MTGYDMNLIYRPPQDETPPLECIGYIKISMPDWKKVREEFETKGWKCDLDDEDRIVFSLLEDEDHEWMIDYDKKTGRSYRMNGRQKINILCSYDETPEETTPTK